MATTTLSSKGQVIIPKPLRDSRGWKSGQRFDIVESDEGIMLKPVQLFPPTTIDEVSGCLAYQGKPKSLAEMDEAIGRGVKETFRDRD